MAVTASTFRLPLGTALPELQLPDHSGNLTRLAELRGQGALVVVFACNHCPYVKHLEKHLGALAAAFVPAGVQFAAICSNDINEYPDDDIPGLTDQRSRASWDFPYLIDANQTAALAFSAACTPDFFVFDRSGRLAYRGAYDHSTPGNGVAITGELLQTALELLLAGQPVPEPHKPALGCGIKWLPGNEPS